MSRLMIVEFLEVTFSRHCTCKQGRRIRGGQEGQPDKIVEEQNFLFAPPLFVTTERTKFHIEIAQRVKENFTMVTLYMVAQ